MENNNTKAVATQPKNGIRELIASDAVKKQIALALPKHMTADRMARVALTAINKTPKLLNCTRESLLAAIMTCSQFGIEPDGRHAHLIPYGDQCQLIIDYKGIVALVRRTGDVADIHADVVCANDDFDYCFGTGSQLKHKPNLKSRGEPIAFYSYVRLKDGSESFEVLGIEEVNAVRSRSRSGNNGPWVTDFNEMGKKTAFKRHSKWLPLSTEVLDAMSAEDDGQPVGENARFEAAKPIFGNVVVDPVASIEAPKDEPKSEKPPLTLVEQIDIKAQESQVMYADIVPALKKLGQLPERANSIKSVTDLTEEKQRWVLENFDQMFAHMRAAEVVK